MSETINLNYESSIQLEQAKAEQLDNLNAAAVPDERETARRIWQEQDELTPLVSANAHMLVKPSWMSGQIVPLGVAMNNYPWSPDWTDPGEQTFLISVVLDLLANRVNETEEPEEESDDEEPAEKEEKGEPEPAPAKQQAPEQKITKDEPKPAAKVIETVQQEQPQTVNGVNTPPPAAAKLSPEAQPVKTYVSPEAVVSTAQAIQIEPPVQTYSEAKEIPHASDTINEPSAFTRPETVITENLSEAATEASEIDAFQPEIKPALISIEQFSPADIAEPAVVEPLQTAPISEIPESRPVMPVLEIEEEILLADEEILGDDADMIDERTEPIGHETDIAAMAGELIYERSDDEETLGLFDEAENGPELLAGETTALEEIVFYQSAEELFIEETEPAEQPPAFISDEQPAEQPAIYVAENPEPIRAAIEEIEGVLYELVENTENRETEPAEEVIEILEKINEVQATMEPGPTESQPPELEPDAREELEELIIELFEATGVDYGPEIIEYLAQAVIKQHVINKIRDTYAGTDESPKDYGTHEIIKQLLTGLSNIKTEIYACAIGRSAIRLLSLSPA